MLQRDFGIRVPTALADADLSRECSTWNTSFPTRAPLLLNPPQTSHAFSKPAGRASCLARLFHVEHSSEAGGPGTELFHVEQSSCGSSLFHVSTGASQANLRWGFPHSDFVPRETYCNRMPVPGTGITFFVQRDEVGGPGTELFHVEQSCGSSLFHVRVRALDALPSGSSSLARGSENHSPEGPARLKNSSFSKRTVLGETHDRAQYRVVERE